MRQIPQGNTRGRRGIEEIDDPALSSPCREAAMRIAKLSTNAPQSEIIEKDGTIFKLNTHQKGKLEDKREKYKNLQF
jgi:hypothetical protein